MTDKELLKMFGLYDKTITLTVEDDIVDTMNNHYKEHLEHEEKKKEFIQLFKECYDELCIFMEKDPEHKVAISCYTCLKGMDLSKQYGKPKKK